MCNLLIDCFACINGLSFSSIPSPYEMAKSMKLNDIFLMFKESLKEQGLLDQHIFELSSKPSSETDSECLSESDHS